MFLPPTTPVPMPDLNSQPIEPDEPIYCLCQQVSFGEMIGCDNEEVRTKFTPRAVFSYKGVGLIILLARGAVMQPHTHTQILS